MIILFIGKRGKYWNLLSVILYGYLPNTLIILLRTLYGLPGRGLGVASLLSQDTSLYLFHLLKGIDFFYIWSIVLIICGITMTYELKRRETFFVTLLFLVYLFIISLLSLRFQRAAPEGNLNRRPRFFRFLRPRPESPVKPKP